MADNYTVSAKTEQVLTCNDEDLITWWHSKNEINSTTPVADENVRRSAHYDVLVAKTSEPDKWYTVFSYMSIPRGGRQKWGYDSWDGAEFASAENFSMSWSTFLYASDVNVEVKLTDGISISSVNDITFRPRQLSFKTTIIDNKTIRFTVPYTPNGLRFSVEFRPHLVEVYSNAGTLNTNRSGSFVEEEPRNALLLFAEPLPKNEIATRTIPNTNSGSIFYPVEGDVHNLDTISQEIIFFKPGNYFMPWNYSAQLPKNVKWVYFAPGSYVKGAIQFLYDNQPLYKVTGFGVLSGEKYVYEPDKNNGYQHRDASQPNCHGSCVKMLQFASSNSQQSLDLQGLTITEPPYHSFVVYGNDNTFKMHVENYKQVGSWYWQTDGIELYSGSTMRNTFFHSNDDVLKLYHSDVSIDNTVIWKNENGPVIQWGWAPRNISDVVVKNTSVIHNRMSWNNLTYNTGVINSSSSWQDMNATNTADLGTSIKNITIDGITVEGAVNCALRLYALSNTENIIIKNLHIDRWSDLNQTATQSIFKAYTNSSNQPVSIGNQTAENKGIKLINYKIGSTIITKKSDNWRAENIGKLNFDSQLWNNWDAWVDTSDTGSVTSTAFLPSLHSLSNIGQNHSTMIKIIISSGPKKLFVPEGTKNIEIFNMLGKKIVSRSNPGSRQCWIELSRESITMGVYLVKCARTFGDW